MRSFNKLMILAAFVCASAFASASEFNNAPDYQLDDYGSYYIITGGKFVNGQTINGDNGSGGTIRYLYDDTDSGACKWQKDDWFSDNASFALTLKNQNSLVYNNNGIEDNTYGDYYQFNGSHSTHGLYRGYSMSNNFDWIYAGYFKLTEATTFDTVIGYFDKNGSTSDRVAFDPYSSAIGYRMNIWSNTQGLLPKNTGGFAGDIFTTDTTSGSFNVSDTGISRLVSAGVTDPIYRLSFQLDSPITLPAGEYWFSHDAVIIPEPATMCLLGLGGLLFARRRK